jgi:predicted metal-dependent hydrolase
MPAALSIGNIKIEVVKKGIKNVHLTVHPPLGRVRIAVPRRMSSDTIRLFAISKLPWIRQQQAAMRAQERETAREYVDLESHYFLGRRYLLKVVEGQGTSKVELRRGKVMQLRVRPTATLEQREQVLQRWYRERLRELIPPLLSKWEKALGVRVAGWGIKKMKTKWGSCNPKARRVWLNLELAKKPPECLEYLVVHELAHLLVRHHDEHFGALMDRHMPGWKHIRNTLNRTPLANDHWDY